MERSKRRFWAIRTDKDNSSVLFAELQKGRLRQGWGYDASQDLQLLQAEIDKGGSWWDRLKAVQKESLPQLRMLSKSEDSIQLKDIIIIWGMHLTKVAPICCGLSVCAL
jgi:hypothetical protein